MKEMTSFAGWGFINSSSSMFAQYGMGIVLNSFFGTILSAAQGVANQISGQLMVFSRTMLMAINPIIGKKAGSNDITNMMRISLLKPLIYSNYGLKMFRNGVYVSLDLK